MKIKIGNKIYGLKYVDSDEYGQSLMELIEEEPVNTGNPEELKEGDVVIAWESGKEYNAIIGTIGFIYTKLFPTKNYLIQGSGTFDNAIKWNGTAKQYFDIKNQNKYEDKN